MSAVVIPIADRLHKVNMQIITMPVPAQDGITRDNVMVGVDGILYLKVLDPERAEALVASGAMAVFGRSGSRARAKGRQTSPFRLP